MFTFASSLAFDPRVIKLSVDFICAVPEPSSAPTTATRLAGLEGPALGTPFKVTVWVIMR